MKTTMMKTLPVGLIQCHRFIFIKNYDENRYVVLLFDVHRFSLYSWEMKMFVNSEYIFHFQSTQFNMYITFAVSHIV